jgi:hypothetical protein
MGSGGAALGAGAVFWDGLWRDHLAHVGVAA